MLKTVEMVVDFRRNPPAIPPLTIMNSTVTAVEISQDLNWDTHIDCKKSPTKIVPPSPAEEV